ncbi:TetR/AcrR family transcriptional regulator [Geodermatophilus sp. DSM 44513]|uniref:TetR/AcrR family transcriptional regulator n=1 Tax=Geodermatophilus sp. DSM 44513 TaxID=1528104 RepID=UPI0028F73D49|nr:TetR/AcrR family transcriptional regulator [Geodermatophilus sp. DSM 44513]WNV74292.1 TetR/AcrR family transcriptional regulator [Geodermatophilus sp. DSM 44513]
MSRGAPASIRVLLVERAAAMLARREPVTLRALVEGTGASTMAVYTHFGSMSGLWRAVRQEGFTRLTARLAAVEQTTDPVRDLMALGAAYVGNALANPAFYRAMFDTAAELEDPQAAAQTFQVLVSGAVRAQQAGRFADSCDPEAVATQFWATGHGLMMLVLTGILPRSVLETHVPNAAAALFVAAGDHQDRCWRSVRAGWSTMEAHPQQASG